MTAREAWLSIRKDQIFRLPAQKDTLTCAPAGVSDVRPPHCSTSAVIFFRASGQFEIGPNPDVIRRPQVWILRRRFVEA